MNDLIVSDFLRSGFVFSADTANLWVGWGIPRRSNSPDSLGEFWIYAPDFFLKDPKPWWCFPHLKKVSVSDFLGFLAETPSVSDSWLKWSPPNRSEFEKRFEDIQNRIRSGELRKAVPVVIETAEGSLHPEVRGVLLKNLIQACTGFPLTVYAFWNNTEGILGASPETLFEQRQSGRLDSMALAGTRKKDLISLMGSLLDDPKEKAEHQIVVEGIRESLVLLAKELGTSPEGILTGILREQILPSLVHLMTPICWESPLFLLEYSKTIFETLVRSLHPTPALGAYPRETGLKWLEGQANNALRGRFGAPFGIVTETGENHCIVGIRNIQWNSHQVTLCAGCGIVGASQLEREWKELQAKIQSVKQLFGIAQASREPQDLRRHPKENL